MFPLISPIIVILIKPIIMAVFFLSTIKPLIIKNVIIANTASVELRVAYMNRGARYTGFDNT